MLKSYNPNRIMLVSPISFRASNAQNLPAREARTGGFLE
jgi:hypothetical protein